MGPNPSEGETTGELSEGLMTEKGEPKMLVGLLEAELSGCCEDMASKLPSGEEDAPSEGYQSEGQHKGGDYSFISPIKLANNLRLRSNWLYLEVALKTRNGDVYE